MGRPYVEIDEMELMFNELSLTGIETIGEWFSELPKIREKLRQHQIRVCRISSKSILKIAGFVNENREAQGFLWAFFRPPFDRDVLESVCEEYCKNTWAFEDKDCEGLIWAVVLQSPSLSLNVDPWRKDYLEVRKNDNSIQVFNIYSERFEDPFVAWLDCQKEVELEECLIDPKEKKITLRDDHGKDVLMRFSQRICNSQYVCEIINSLEWQRYNRKFIREIHDDGIIYITLPWTDQGLGIAVKTTGRNRKETELIASILQREYE